MAKQVNNDKVDFMIDFIVYAFPVLLALGVGIFMHHSLSKTNEVNNRIESYLQEHDKNYQDYFEKWIKRDQAQKEAAKRQRIIAAL